MPLVFHLFSPPFSTRTLLSTVLACLLTEKVWQLRIPGFSLPESAMSAPPQGVGPHAPSTTLASATGMHVRNVRAPSYGVSEAHRKRLALVQKARNKEAKRAASKAAAEAAKAAANQAASSSAAPAAAAEEEANGAPAKSSSSTQAKKRKRPNEE